MPKPLRDIAVIRQPDLKGLIRATAAQRYGEIEPDLPKHGRGHYDAAIDVVADHLYDRYRDLRGKDLRKMAQVALKDYVPDDRKETRAYERKLARRKPVYVNVADLKPVSDADIAARKQAPPAQPKLKPRRGIGSY